VDEAGMLALRAHSWPGNVRELRSIVQVALVESAGNRLMLEKALARTKADASPERASGLYDDARREFDRGYYTALYIRFGGNLSKIAKEAGKQRVTVRAALRVLGLYGDGSATEKGT
jgi:DNA-binding NtrC family response regulator